MNSRWKNQDTHWGGFLVTTKKGRGVLLRIFFLIFSTVSPLHTNLQFVNFQRCERASGSSKEPEPVPSASGLSEIAACPPPPIADNPSTLPLLPPPVSNSSCLFMQWQPLHASCCTVLLYFSKYYTIRFKMCSLFFMFVFYVLLVWKVL